jgi:hypothetical protein
MNTMPKNGVILLQFLTAMPSSIPVSTTMGTPKEYAYLLGLAKLDSFEDNVILDGPPGLDLDYKAIFMPTSIIASCMFAR